MQLVITALIQGHVTANQFKILVAMSGLQSENVIAALEDHLVRGMAQSVAQLKHDVKQQNFSRALKNLNLIYAQIETFNIS